METHFKIGNHVKGNHIVVKYCRGQKRTCAESVSSSATYWMQSLRRGLSMGRAWRERLWWRGSNLVNQEVCFQWNRLNVVQVSPKDEARSLLMLGKLYKSYISLKKCPLRKWMKCSRQETLLFLATMSETVQVSASLRAFRIIAATFW